ncbi:MAG TPA: lysylphosphatidylglycerol synthase transmembrane domain-containing protein [Dokdonella sp.]|nr:lysylphosphatidylglycerol synthase transmembrane domain-containing protein [Dokdonella sp.]
MTRKPGRLLRIGIGAAVSAGCIAFILWRVDLDALWRALTEFRWIFVVFALAALALDYSLRILRWTLMLRHAGAAVSAADCAPAFLGSMALNNILPLRAGDIVRALVFPLSLGVRRTASTATLVLERVLDFLALMICFGVGVWLSPTLRIPILEKDLLLALTTLVGGLVIMLVFFASGIGRTVQLLVGWTAQCGWPKVSTILKHLRELLGSLYLISRVRVLAWLTLLSILVWLANAGLFLAVLRGFSIPSPPSTALVIMAIATLSTLVPSSPGYVGPFHLAAYAALIMIGASQSTAAGFALISHLVLWVPVTIAGLFAITLTPSLFRKTTRDRAIQE